MNIPYPSDGQIREASQRICREALAPRETVLGFLKNMTARIGLLPLLTGSLDAAVVALAVFLGVGTSVPMRLIEFPEGKAVLTVFIFAFSPAFFGLYYALSMGKERVSSLWQIKMSCKYTVRHLLACRMFYLSLVSALLNGVYILVLCERLALPALKLLCICFTALFLFSLLLLAVLLRFDSVASVLGLYALWIGGGAAGALLIPEQLAFLLTAIPVLAWLLVDGALVILLRDRFAAYINRRSCYAGC